MQDAVIEHPSHRRRTGLSMHDVEIKKQATVALAEKEANSPPPYSPVSPVTPLLPVLPLSSVPSPASEWSSVTDPEPKALIVCENGHDTRLKGYQIAAYCVFWPISIIPMINRKCRCRRCGIMVEKKGCCCPF